MKKILYFVIFLFCFLTSINTYALSNTDTSFTFNIQEQDFSEQFFSDMTYKDVLDYFTNYNSDYYDIVVFYTSSKKSINIVLEPKNTGIFKGIYGQNVGRYSSNLSFYSSVNNKIEYTGGLSFNTNIVSSNSQIFLKIKQCLDSNICSSGFSSTDNTGTFAKSTNGTAGNYTILTSSAITNIGNNNSYVYEDYTLATYLYSSQIPVYLRFPASPSTYFGKSVYINDNYYTTDSILPTYVDLFGGSSSDSFIGYQNSLDTFYTNFLPNQFNSFNLDIKFRLLYSVLGNNQNPVDYINNVKFDYICNGRINNNTYYSYQSFPCSLNYTYTYDDRNINMIFNNLTTDFDYSVFDKIYVSIKSNYLDANVNTTFFDLSYRFTGSSVINTSYKGNIYENFVNLPLNFKMYLSSNNSLQDSNLYINNTNFNEYGINYVGFSNLNGKQNTIFGTSVLSNTLIDSTNEQNYISLYVSNEIDTGIMIYQKDSNSVLPNLDLFFNPNIVLSLNSNDSDNFYYLNEEGNIVNNDFTIPESSEENNYDITFYVNKIKDFINELSSDSLEFSIIIQNFYDSMPLFFKSFIFIVFILFCIYFCYLLIRGGKN